MWLWDYIMLVRQRQAVRRNVRVPVVYIGIGESPHEYSHMCVCVRACLSAQLHSLFVFRHLLNKNNNRDAGTVSHAEKAL